MIEYLEGFAGGGGATSGLEATGLYRLVAAINHEPTAVKNHKANFPWADHYCHNMQETHPSAYPKTDVCWMSPSCQNHSRAKGVAYSGQMSLWQDDPTNQADEKSRALMEQVVHYTRQHRYRIVFVENVPEVRKWTHFNRWLSEMVAMGYSYKLLYLNSMFFGVPQSRDRFYAVFWAKGVPTPDLTFTPAAPCPTCNKQVLAVQVWKGQKQWGIYGRNGQYVYRCPHCTTIVNPVTVPASSVIDTHNIGQRIKDRKHPLRPNTMNRIRAGVQRLSHEVTQMGISYYGREDTAFRLDAPLPTLTAGGNRHALLTCPQHITYYYGSGDGQPTTLDKPLCTIPTVIKQALVTPSLDSHDLDDIVQNSHYRMLTIKELQAAMGFPDTYVMADMPQRDQIKILGNAVTPAVAQWLGERCAPSLM